jgi:AcrR family transcriptional regulator
MDVNPGKPGGGVMSEAERTTGLPASFETAWGVRARPPRGPRPGLSLERIVEAAVRIATAEGLAAVSMNRVADELGAGTMALYRYVGAKDELLTLMVDAALGPAPGVPPGGWRTGLEAWARSYVDVLRRAPWVVRVPIGGPPITPNNVAWFDRGLRALRDTALEAGERLSVLILLSGYVRNQAGLEADLAEAFSASDGTAGKVAASYGTLLATLTDAERYPALHELLAEGTFDEDPEAYDRDAEFEFGLQRFLDGIDALVRKRRSKGGSPRKGSRP